MAEKRKRGHNFSCDEKHKLIKLLSLHNDSILNKRTDGTTNHARNYAWVSLTNKFNSSGHNYRTKESLMKLWEKLKSEAKLYGSSIKKCTTGKGGAPSSIKTDSILSQVCDILGRGCTGIENINGSDADFSEVPTVNDSDTEKMPQEVTAFILQTQEKEQQDEKEDKAATPAINEAIPIIEYATPWPEAVSSLCSGFKVVNKKKLDIEDLKKKLLEEELEFKRKLYQLQLQAAAKDVEIKNEILSQMKGGGLSQHNLFGVPKND